MTWAAFFVEPPLAKVKSLNDKTLLLLRHTKSSWRDGSLEDHDRPLSARGQRAGRALAKMMATLARPDEVLCSAAVRTQQTWTLVSTAWTPTLTPAFDESLYLAHHTLLLQRLKAANAEHRCLLLIGHNPGMEQLAHFLAGPTSSAEALAHLRQKYPTGGLAVLKFDGAWAALSARTARLTAFVTPAQLGVGKDD